MLKKIINDFMCETTEKLLKNIIFHGEKRFTVKNRSKQVVIRIFFYNFASLKERGMSGYISRLLRGGLPGSLPTGRKPAAIRATGMKKSIFIEKI